MEVVTVKIVDAKEEDDVIRLDLVDMKTAIRLDTIWVYPATAGLHEHPSLQEEKKILAFCGGLKMQCTQSLVRHTDDQMRGSEHIELLIFLVICGHAVLQNRHYLEDRPHPAGHPAAGGVES